MYNIVAIHSLEISDSISTANIRATTCLLKNAQTSLKMPCPTLRQRRPNRILQRLLSQPQRLQLLLQLPIYLVLKVRA